jgi:hypothetical protein
MYFIGGQVRFANDSTNNAKARGGRIQVNASSDLDTQYFPTAPGNSTQVYLKGYRQLAAGDYLVLSAANYETASAENLHVGISHYTYLRAKWMNA